jgi:hypothetical protein
LQQTKKVGVRFCEECRKKVYYCHTIEEARDHADQGHCVAVDASVPRQPDDLMSDFDLVLGADDAPQPDDLISEVNLVLGGCEEDDDYDEKDDEE